MPSSRSRLVLPLAGALLAGALLEPVLPGHAAAGAVPRQAAAERCVVLARAGGALVLVNRCPACRAVGVERRDARGRWSRTGYMVAPVSMVTLPSRGAGGLRLADERSCTRAAPTG